jgi:hypothetical protein
MFCEINCQPCLNWHFATCISPSDEVEKLQTPTTEQGCRATGANGIGIRGIFDSFSSFFL